MWVPRTDGWPLFWLEFTRMSMEFTSELGCNTYLGDVYPTYLYRGDLFYLPSTSRTSLVGLVLDDWPSKKIIHTSSGPGGLGYKDLCFPKSTNSIGYKSTNQFLHHRSLQGCFPLRTWFPIEYRGHVDTFLPWFWKYNFSWSNSFWVWKLFFIVPDCVCEQSFRN